MKKTLLQKTKIKKQIPRRALITVEFVKDNPDLNQIPEGKLIVVGVKNKYSKWAYMKCPSGCGETLMLSLQKNDDPSWRLRIDKSNRPSLYPSIWKTDGCKSHFLLRKGEIVDVNRWLDSFSLNKS